NRLPHAFCSSTIRNLSKRNRPANHFGGKRSEKTRLELPFDDPVATELEADAEHGESRIPVGNSRIAFLTERARHRSKLGASGKTANPRHERLSARGHNVAQVRSIESLSRGRLDLPDTLATYVEFSCKGFERDRLFSDVSSHVDSGLPLAESRTHGVIA